MFGFGEDEDGELYVLASDNIGPIGKAGVVYRIVPPGPKPIPTLPEWGFAALTLLVLTAATVVFGRRRQAAA